MTEQEIKALLQQADDLYLKGQLDQAIEILRRIKREDSPKLYAKAQLNLGVVLGAQGDTEGAIAAYRNITREDSSETYAKAQFNLGVILGEQGDTEGAIAAYRSIKREDSPETYVMAQVNLGAALGKQGDTEGAIAACRNVTREDSREQYAKAQVNLGVALAKQGKTDEAIDTFRNIQPEDSKESYAKAQFGLSILEARGDTEGAIAVYRNITREDSRELYAKAKFNLGVTLEAQGDTEGAIAAYRKITRKDSSELYAMAQFNLGVALQEQGKIEEAKQAFSNSRSVFYYQAESQLKILNCPPDSRSNLAAVYDAIESIIQTLFISSYGGIAGENPLKVAHYTRPSTAGKLIAGDSAKASPLRLSTVKNTNDPTEGKILYGYLHKSCGLPSGVLDVEQEFDSQALAAFISCFTFNHDSLNQFRLYGKEDGLEASGVSLVFEKHFFSAADPFAIMTAAPEREAIMTANNTIEDSRPERADKTTQKKLDKLPLYRCIYLDPQSGYVSIAHRDKVTFYAEACYGKKTAAH
ncbi:MAG: tetratricopeptide repeat protein [Cardiobacterium hominis]